ncbi:hypothetical protein SAMN05216349_12913 [Oribacterium sp. KHPX15]|uniref:ligand-binding sensor domain-containing protein n=1 Tax=unclassified Oribacterium TaxID=2629782 RepID=UPI0004E0CC81|nr:MULTISPECIES: hypothetical protein [unclassified Oribacterium]SEA79236.1 hypothetical protein SAMN05216349_12913 [Oribacterium sp. KHPX15]
MNKKSILILVIIFGLLIISGIAYQILTRKPVTQKDEALTVLMAGTEISALFDDGDEVWAGTGEGVFIINRDTGETIKKLDPDIHMIFSAMITKTEDGLIWVGHEDGLSAFDMEYNEVYRFSSPEIPQGRVNTLLADEDGLWAGSQNGAAHLSLREGSWVVDEILTTESGLSEDVVQVIKKVGDELWFGSYLAREKGGISIFSDAGWTYLNVDDGIPHSYINAILPLSDTKVLIGSGQMIYGGLSIAEKTDEKWTITANLDQNDGIPGMKVRDLFMDSAGRLFITTEAEGIIILKNPEELNTTPLEGQILSQENGLSDNEVKCIIECDSCYFFGCKYGLTRWDKI